MFNALLKALFKEIGERRTSTAAYILDKTNENTLKYHSTNTRWTQYKSGTITREQAEQYAIKRAFQDIEKDKEKELSRINNIFDSVSIKSINVSVEWVKSRVWGYNPQVTVIAIDENGKYIRTFGSASGCGYDKESAATAEAFNQINGLLKDLYRIKNKALNKDRAATSHTCLGYGSGYGVLPYFESGVGFSCHESILNKCGFVTKNRFHGKYSDSYYFEKR